MENKSQVLLKAGDRVLTSKGNIGEIVKSANLSWQLFEEKGEVLNVKSPALVRIGNKSYPIAECQLTKLDTLFPVRVIWTADPTGMERDIETVVYLPKDFCLLCNGDNAGGNNLYSRIIPFLQSQVGVRDYITIFKIYAL